MAVAILISDKIGFKSKTVTRDRGHHMLTNISIQQEDIIIISIYAPNVRLSKYMTQKLAELKGKIDSSTIIVVDPNTPLGIMDRTTRQKISEEIEGFNNTINQLDLIDLYRTLLTITTAYIFFLSAHGTFSWIDHM